MRKIKIAHCMSGLDGGVGNVVFNYFDAMPQSDYEVDVLTQNITSDKYVKQYEKRNFRIIRIPKKSKSLWKNLSTLYQIMKKNKYDIVHAHMTLTNCFPLFIAWLCGIKVRISHSHMAVNHTIASKLLAFFSRLFATDYFACGKDAGHYLFGHHDFVILNNAINLEKYCFNPEIRKKERAKLHIEDSDVLLGHIGRFTRQKNHYYLIDLFEEIRRINSHYKLMLVGSGELFEEVKAEVQRRSLEKDVFFLGIIDDVNKKLQAMDVFVLPSLYEGLCLAAIEAQASGVSCVFSDSISHETRKNKNVMFCELKNSKIEWIRCIEKLKEEREFSCESLNDSGYNIRLEANKLDDFYKKKIDYRKML